MRIRRARIIVTALLSVSIVSPRFAVAESETEPAVVPVITDVQLKTESALHGTVVNPEGTPIAEAMVAVWYQDQLVAETQADANGQFRVNGLRGGVHYVTTAENVAVFRFWTPNTAPPSAIPQVLVVDDPTIVRGNNCCSNNCGQPCDPCQNQCCRRPCNPCANRCAGACRPCPPPPCNSYTAHAGCCDPGREKSPYGLGDPGSGPSELVRLLRNPVVIGGLIATAIAVPVALNSSDKSGS